MLHQYDVTPLDHTTREYQTELGATLNTTSTEGVSTDRENDSSTGNVDNDATLVDSTHNPFSSPAKKTFVGLPNFHSSSSVGRNSIHSASLSMGSMNEVINSMVEDGSLVLGGQDYSYGENSTGGSLSYKDGTALKPSTVQVDLSFPERNREFDILRVSNLEHNDCKYYAVHIRTSIAIQDAMKWTASIPRKLPKHLRQYQERIVWIEGRV